MRNQIGVRAATDVLQQQTRVESFDTLCRLPPGVAKACRWSHS
jgi:hypothetical protein